MTKYYVKWTMNPLEMPKNPEERMKLWQMSLKMVEDGFHDGHLKDWGMTADLSEGYAIVEGADDTDIAAYLLRWIPSLNLVGKPILSLDESVEALKKLITSMKK